MNQNKSRMVRTRYMTRNGLTSPHLTQIWLPTLSHPDWKNSMAMKKDAPLPFLEVQQHSIPHSWATRTLAGLMSIPKQDLSWSFNTGACFILGMMSCKEPNIQCEQILCSKRMANPNSRHHPRWSLESGMVLGDPHKASGGSSNFREQLATNASFITTHNQKCSLLSVTD